MQPATASARKKKVTGASAYTESGFAKRDPAIPASNVKRIVTIVEDISKSPHLCVTGPLLSVSECKAGRRGPASSTRSRRPPGRLGGGFCFVGAHWLCRGATKPGSGADTRLAVHISCALGGLQRKRRFRRPGGRFRLARRTGAGDAILAAKGLDSGYRVSVSFMRFDHGGRTSLARFLNHASLSAIRSARSTKSGSSSIIGARATVRPLHRGTRPKPWRSRSK